MNNKTKAIIGAVVIAGAFFYGGYAYANGQAASVRAQARSAFGNGAGAGFVRGGMNGGRGGVAGANGAAGTIIAKDAQSITVQLQGGGSKIIFVGSSTEVMKTVAGSANDLSVGETIIAAGTTNSDGSITASMVQIRPARQATTTSAQVPTRQ